jgi:hypothetical protein
MMYPVVARGPRDLNAELGVWGGVYEGLKKFTKVGKNLIFSTFWQWVDTPSSSKQTLIFIRRPEYAVAVRKLTKNGIHAITEDASEVSNLHIFVVVASI